MGSEWRTSTWGDEISLEYGKALRGHDAAQDRYRVFGSNGPIGWSAQPLTEGPGVVLGRKGAYRGVQFSRDPFFVIDTAYYVVPKSELDMRWLYYAIKHYKLGEVDDGSPIPSTTRAAVYVLDLDVPPPAEQRAIAHILGTLDDKIELNRRMNETLEAMARALFKSWFVDFEPVRAKADGRDPGLPEEIADLFSDRLVDSELGEIPEGWDVLPLRDLTEYLSRGIGPTYVESGGICVLNQKCIRNRRIDFAKARRHDQGKKSIEGRLLRRLDVLVNSTGVGTLGRVAQLWYLPEPAIVDSHVTILRAAHGIDPWFFGVGLTDREVEIESLGEGSTGQTELSRSQLGDLACLVPPIDLQSHFGFEAAQLLGRVSLSEQESHSLAALRDTLLPRLISGELRLSESTSLLEEFS